MLNCYVAMVPCHEIQSGCALEVFLSESACDNYLQETMLKLNINTSFKMVRVMNEPCAVDAQAVN